ncbi:MAG: M23 family metallopeptidase [Solirubrobacteraceae bacterium]
MPADLLTSITGLTDGLFPVHAAARYTQTPGTRGAAIDISARPGSPAIAVKDGVITSIGTSPSSGAYVVLRDAVGNTYTYGALKVVSRLYVEPKPTAAIATRAAAADPSRPADPTPAAPASAGHQTSIAAPSPTASVTPTRRAAVATSSTSAAPTSRAAVARATTARSAAASKTVELARYLTRTGGLEGGDGTVKPLVAGAHVLAGTILGRIGVTGAGGVSRLILRSGRPARGLRRSTRSPSSTDGSCSTRRRSTGPPPSTRPLRGVRP